MLLKFQNIDKYLMIQFIEIQNISIINLIM